MYAMYNAKTLSNTEAEWKKNVAYEKVCNPLHNHKNRFNGFPVNILTFRN